MNPSSENEEPAMGDLAFQYDLFLSHSAKDKAVVRPLAERLSVVVRKHLKVWFDEWVLKPGDSIPAKIEEGLEHSRMLVLCMSAQAFGSDRAQLLNDPQPSTNNHQPDCAPLDRERRFMPLRLDDAGKVGIAAELADNQRAHA
jgi:hypothetical protein